MLPVLYAAPWLLTCFASDFPLPFAARVLDLVITDCWAAPMLKVSCRGQRGWWAGVLGKGLCGEGCRCGGAAAVLVGWSW